MLSIFSFGWRSALMRETRTSMVQDQDPYVGRVLDEKYLIVCRLGTGGMATVYEGHNLAIGRRVAIKLLHPHHAMLNELVGRFEREARAAARVRHPNIVDVLDMGRTAEGARYIVMERLEGDSLFDRMTAVGPLTPAESASILIQALTALEAAHQAGIVHRDVKPENVFLATSGDGREVVKLLDFGVAKVAEPGRREHCGVTGDGHIVGTPAYMSPEQATGCPVDARTDLYAAGVLLYELLAAQLPYEGDGPAVLSAIASRAPTPLEAVAPWLPFELISLVHKAIAREPEDRFQDAAEFIAALEAFLPDSDPLPGARALALWRARTTFGSVETRQSRTTVAVAPRRRRRAPRAAIAVLLSLIAIGAAVALTQLGVGPGSSQSAARERPPARPTVAVEPRPRPEPRAPAVPSTESCTPPERTAANEPEAAAPPVRRTRYEVAIRGTRPWLPFNRVY